MSQQESQLARSKHVGRGFWKRFNCLGCSTQARARRREEESQDIGMPGSSRLMLSGLVWGAKSCFGVNNDSSNEMIDCCRRREPARCNRRQEEYKPWYQPFPDESAEIARQPKQSSPGVYGRPRENFPVSPITPEGQESRFFTYPAYEAEDILPELRRPQSGYTRSKKEPRASDVFVKLHDSYDPQQDFIQQDRQSRWHRKGEPVQNQEDWDFYFGKG